MSANRTAVVRIDSPFVNVRYMVKTYDNDSLIFLVCGQVDERATALYDEPGGEIGEI